jgi:hypothetical protein
MNMSTHYSAALPLPADSSAMGTASPTFSPSWSPPIPVTPPPLPDFLPITQPNGEELSQSTSSFPPSQSLTDPELVIQYYPKLLNIEKISRLAVKLAREAYFGSELMRASTVYGCRNIPGLPKHKVDDLKKFLCLIFPDLRQNPTILEDKWKQCVHAINHACASLRKANNN